MVIALGDVRFWGFPVTPLKTQAFFAIWPPDLRLTLQRGRKARGCFETGPGIERRMGEPGERHSVDSGTAPGA